MRQRDYHILCSMLQSQRVCQCSELPFNVILVIVVFMTTVPQVIQLRTGLVLGAGGVLGGAWMAGALLALADRTRWYPRRADHIVGTSAGSVLAVLGAAGVPPWLLIPESAPHIYHGLIDAHGNLELDSDLWQRIVRRRHLGLPRLAPGSLSLTVAGLRAGRWTFLKTISGLAPAGFISTDAIKDTVRWIAPYGGWVDHPNTWIVACDYQTGERVVFGRAGSPEASVPQAVAASCAIPGYYCPEVIGNRKYVDGGLHSMSNLDLLAGQHLDLVIVLSPLSTRTPFRGWDLLNRFSDTTRRAVARQLDAEIGMLQAQGTQVMVLEPLAEDLVAMGGNVMDDRRRARVMQTAARTTLEQLNRPEFSRLLAHLELPPRMPRLEPARLPRRAKPRLRPAV
jgi:NTE family protein